MTGFTDEQTIEYIYNEDGSLKVSVDLFEIMVDEITEKRHALERARKLLWHFKWVACILGGVEALRIVLWAVGGPDGH